jgi:hypothetical protein
LACGTGFSFGSLWKHDGEFPTRLVFNRGTDV